MDATAPFLAALAFAAMTFVAGFVLGRTVEADRWRRAARSAEKGASVHYGGRQYRVEQADPKPE
ncbi:MAG: hypothetical protein K8U57_11105 [Planctomycetes bacterium]|nr:hypothetical protein [Planctomycetota bacterium]